LRLAPSPAAARSRGGFHTLAVTAVEPVAQDAVAVSFKVPAELRDAFRYEAGQHLTLRAWVNGAEVRRTYSICVPPSSGQLKVGVRRVPGGVLSEHIFEVVKPGVELEVMEPAGRFTLPFDRSAERSYVALVAGSGITPVLALAAEALVAEPRSEVTIFYGNRTVETAMFLDELADLKDRYPSRLQLLHLFSRQRQQVELTNGRLDPPKIQLLVDRFLVDPRRVAAFLLCGPFPMIQGARATLIASGVAAERIKAELFFVEEEAPVRSVEEQLAMAQPGQVLVRARLNGRETEFSMPRSEKIVDALARVRPDAPFSCKGGVCGTCRARLLEGRVAMDHTYALEQADRSEGYVLTCQSHPLSDSVFVDYDA
jgi:ring-1,2-phenylacetyl-CoA epoxidase subunit PaaE